MDSGNYADARLYLEQAVKGGDGAAACLLGEMTLKGLGGIEASHDKAASLFREADGLMQFVTAQRGVQRPRLGVVDEAVAIVYRDDGRV